MNETERRRWHLKKELSLGDLIAFVCAIGAVVIAYFTMDKRVAIVEAHAVTQGKETGQIVNQLQRLEDKLDRLIERR